MGKYDSSKYRVKPLMEYINKDKDKLNTILELVNIPKVENIDACFYGDNEKKIKPTKEFLIGLINYVRTINSDILPDIKSRKELYHGNDEERNRKTIEAIKLIEQNYDNLKNGSKWYILEGFTHPDIFIEGDNYVIIVEGKWTEKGITTYTTNLKKERNEYRSQMVRHIQAALNYAKDTNKKVYAFYIVDKECNYIDDLTKSAFEKQIEKETIKVANKEEIKDAFYGYTTWQDIENAIKDINFLDKKEIDKII